MPGQRDHLKACGQPIWGELLGLAWLSQQELVTQVFKRVAAIEKRRLEDGMTGEIPLNAWSIDLATRLGLEVTVATDVVGIGVSVVDGGELPATLV